MTPTPTKDRPASLGGIPIRPEGPPDWPPCDPAIIGRLGELAESGDWGRYHGPWCDRLITAIRSLCGCRHALLCSSGTAAVELALRTVGVGPGDEVLLAAYDFKANFTNVLYLGARPVLVDVRAGDWQLDLDQLDAAWRPEVKAVIASHLHGGLVDMVSLRSWADRRGVAIVEDACQAPGARVQGRPAGLWGDVGVWSFGGSKLLSSGRGGALLTNRDDIAQRLKLIQQRGNEAYPLAEMQAAVLLPQLEQLPERHRRRSQAVARLDALLAAGPMTRLQTSLPESDPAYYKVGWQFNSAAAKPLTREQFSAALRAEGIALDPGFRGLHRIHASSRYRTAGPLARADAADARSLTLHHPVLLAGEAALDQIAAAVRRVQAFAEDLATFASRNQ